MVLVCVCIIDGGVMLAVRTSIRYCVCWIAQLQDGCSRVADNTAHNPTPHNWPFNYSAASGKCNAYTICVLPASLFLFLFLWLGETNSWSSFCFCFLAPSIFCDISILQFSYSVGTHGCLFRGSIAKAVHKMYYIVSNTHTQQVSAFIQAFFPFSILLLDFYLSY